MAMSSLIFRGRANPGPGKPSEHNGSYPAQGPDFELLDEIETQRGENRILKQKLQSKSEALLILTQELDRVKSECEEYRELTQKLQNTGGSSMFRPAPIQLISNSQKGNPLFRDLTFTSHLGELRGENKRLVSDRDTLKLLVKEKEDDVRLLRNELGHARNVVNQHQTLASADASHESRELGSLISKLESLQLKYSSLKQDLQSLLDEKEDMVQERDAYKCKVHRLNHSMSALLKSDGYKIIDLDWLLNENRFLRESLEQVQEEKLLANEMGRKYKVALERSRRVPTLRGAKSGQREDSQKVNEQIVVLLGKTSFPCPLELDLGSNESLQELCLSLLETLNDRMLQLKHQRRANKHIMERMGEFEAKMTHEKHGQLIMHPSKYLMKDFSHVKSEGSVPTNEEVELPWIKQGISRQSSVESSMTQSPEVSDLYKRFQSISIVHDTPPPDLIADGLSRQTRTPSVEPSPPPLESSQVPSESSQSSLDPETLEANKILLEDPIVLPDYLQVMLDEAMRALENEEQAKVD